MGRARRSALFLGCTVLGIYSAADGAAAQLDRQPKAVITAAKAGSQMVGFDVTVAGRVIAPVRFSSNGLITAAKVEEKRDNGFALRFTGLKAREGIGLLLAPDDYVEVTSRADDSYPEVRFRLTIAAFDPEKWAKNAGRFPFHFLAVSMPGAEVFHQRGWLMATPKADPFPLLLDVHIGKPEIAAEWSRNWSYAPPIGCYPIPVIGLWSPAERLYVGYDFLGSRLSDQSERYIASAYCWQQGADRQFVALVYPYAGKGFQTLTYPEKGSAVESRFTLIYSTNMPSSGDPNTLLQEYYFQRFADRLPRVPAMNDMGWLPGGTRLKQPARTPRGGLVQHGMKESRFEEPGTVQIGGWTWHRESAVFAAYRRGDTQAIARLKDDIAYLLSKAERPTIDGQQCLFWPKPLEGKWRDAWGGEPVKTLHNTNAWAAGLVLVDLYRHDHTQEYLPLIDGIYHWTKHFVWTRNEFADVPSSPFAIGGTLSAAFLLDYYFAFRDDPQRAEQAQQALQLARKVTYRYMPAWVCDNDRDDNLDSAFLWEPNSGRDWAGAACANEVHWNLDTLTQVYVNCGDPILHYYLRGALERWHLLYKDQIYPALADYPHDALSEWLGLFDGTVAGRGGRASFGTGDILPMHYPLGDSLLRVTCGEKAAFACCKGGVHSRIEDYRYRPRFNIAFTIRSTRQRPMDVTVSFPFADLTEKPVTLLRHGAARTLESGKDLVRWPDAPSYVYIRGVQDGDTMTIGAVPPETPVLRIDDPWVLRPPSERELVEPPFRMLQLPLDTPLSSDWDDVNSYAGLWPGKHYAWSVPYCLAADESTGAVLSTTQPCTVNFASGEVCRVFVFFSPLTEKANVLVQSEGNATTTLWLSHGALAWRSWPPCFRQKICVAWALVQGAGKVTVTPRDSRLLAVTALTDSSQRNRIVRTLDRGNEEFQKMLAAERRLQGMAALAADTPEGRIAILPLKSQEGPVLKALAASGLLKKCRRLRPEEMLDKNLFRARNFPVLLNLDGEGYAGTIHKEGDGAEAILNYLRSGGLIVMLTSQPLPFHYDGLEKSQKVRSLTPQMGFPITVTFEKPPEGLKIIADIRNNHLSGPDIDSPPRATPFFTTGDLRLRTVRREKVSADAVYTPICSVIGPGGKSYGEAAAYAHFTRGQFQDGGVYYVWSRLLSDEDLGPPLIEETLRFIIAQAGR